MGDTIDLAGISAVYATIQSSNNVLVVQESNLSRVIQLDPNYNFYGYAPQTTSDGHGGTNITLQPTENVTYTYTGAAFDPSAIDPLDEVFQPGSVTASFTFDNMPANYTTANYTVGPYSGDLQNYIPTSWTISAVGNTLSYNDTESGAYNLGTTGAYFIFQSGQITNWAFYAGNASISIFSDGNVSGNSNEILAVSAPMEWKFR